MKLRASLFAMALGWAFAQLSGVINQYAAVVSAPNSSTLVLSSVAGFSPGDRILVYQAKGATITTNNNSTYGDISNIGGAGLFEFANILSINGNTITLSCALTRPFDLSNPSAARIQVVKVSYHPGDVTITGLVTAQPWDTSTGTGGLVVIETNGTLTFSADIDVSGRGFLGGVRSHNASGSGCLADSYFGEIGVNGEGAGKGEGISEWIGSNHRGHRGKSANGGGGGNQHDTGGGGGGNWGAGGQGGWTTCGSGWSCPGFNIANSGFGLGGAALDSYLNPLNLRLFFGGGGGGGHQNNNQGGHGGRGGGVVIIRAATIQGNGRQILARGAQGVQGLPGCNISTNVSYAGNDGGGGGGAGGAVALFCNDYVGNLTINVSGANGQDCSHRVCGCRPDHGPGGGGGGGYVALSTPHTSANLILQLSGGQNGRELTPMQENVPGCNNSCNTNCAGSSCSCNCIFSSADRLSRGARPGGNGGVLHGISFSPYSPCPLAEVRLLRWRLLSLPTGQLHHAWQLTSDAPIAEVSATFIRWDDGTAIEIPLSPQLVGEATHALDPGRYEVVLQVRVRDGVRIAAGRQLLHHDVPFLWKESHLHLPQQAPFSLYDASGKHLLSGSAPTILSFEGLPAGFYFLRLGERTYRLYWMP